jgi:Zn-dependent protease
MIFNPGIRLIGWAKPVPVNLQNLRHPRRDHMWIAAAGPLSNLGLAFGFLFFLGVVLRTSQEARDALRGFLVGGTEALGAGVLEPILLFLWFGVLLNTLLAVFNLLPIAPLDGGAVFQGLLPLSMAERIQGLSRFGFLILFGLLFTGALWYLMYPFYAVLYGIVGVLIS